MNAQQPNLGDTTRSPVPFFAIGSIACSMLSAGIMAAFAPQPAPLGWSAGFLIASVVLLLSTVISMIRRPDFAWKRFFGVAKWVLLMTLVITSMLGYVFVFDGTRGSALVIMVVVLAITAIDIPILFGFSVARHERIPGKS
jgi:hypothetical protein